MVEGQYEIPELGGGETGTKAATLVVASSAADGDYTDIQEAFDALPARGGVIFVREGAFSPGVTYDLPDKDVEIVGAGAGDAYGTAGSTVIDIGTGVFPVFTSIYDSRRYVFRNLLIRANFTSGQHAVSNSGDLNYFSFVDVVFQKCDFIIRDTSTSGSSYGVRRCLSGDPTFQGVNGVFKADTNKVNVLEISDSLLYYGGSVCVAGQPGLYTSSSSIQNFGSRGTTALGVLNASLSSLGQMDITVSGYGDSIEAESTYFTDSTLTIATGEKNSIKGCNFDRYTANTPAITLTAGRASIQGCLFDGYATAISIPSNRNSIMGCLFPSCAVPVDESGDFNIYIGNNEFNGAVIVGGDSVSANNID
jgi:hypothetical protein